MNLPRLQSIGQCAALLVVRIALAVPFWKSGLTKWDGFLKLSDSARTLFREEFRLHIFGNEIPYPMPDVVAHLSGTAEICLPILLVLGLGTRFAAAGILVMTGIIQLTEPDGWANFHLPWAAMALTLVVFGPGRVALDALIARWWRARR
jgi:putative oxidoreductase